MVGSVPLASITDMILIPCAGNYLQYPEVVEAGDGKPIIDSGQAPRLRKITVATSPATR